MSFDPLTAVHYHDGQVTEVAVDGYPLGVRETSEYRTSDIRLAAGDLLILHSDGIPEAVNAAEEMLGYERVFEIVRRAGDEGLDAQAVIDRLVEEVERFRGGEVRRDDMTVVVVRAT